MAANATAATNIISSRRDQLLLDFLLEARSVVVIRSGSSGDYSINRTSCRKLPSYSRLDIRQHQAALSLLDEITVEYKNEKTRRDAIKAKLAEERAAGGFFAAVSSFGYFAQKEIKTFFAKIDGVDPQQDNGDDEDGGDDVESGGGIIDSNLWSDIVQIRLADQEATYSNEKYELPEINEEDDDLIDLFIKEAKEPIGELKITPVPNANRNNQRLAWFHSPDQKVIYVRLPCLRYFLKLVHEIRWLYLDNYIDDSKLNSTDIGHLIKCKDFSYARSQIIKNDIARPDHQSNEEVAVENDSGGNNREEEERSAMAAGAATMTTSAMGFPIVQTTQPLLSTAATNSLQELESLVGGSQPQMKELDYINHANQNGPISKLEQYVLDHVRYFYWRWYNKGFSQRLGERYYPLQADEYVAVTYEKQHPLALRTDPQWTNCKFPVPNVQSSPYGACLTEFTFVAQRYPKLTYYYFKWMAVPYLDINATISVEEEEEEEEDKSSSSSSSSKKEKKKPNQEDEMKRDPVIRSGGICLGFDPLTTQQRSNTASVHWKFYNATVANIILSTAFSSK